MAASRGRGTCYFHARRELERGAGGHQGAPRRARRSGPDARRRATRAGAGAAAPAVPLPAADPLYRAHAAARRGAARSRPTRHPPRDLLALRRSPRAPARGVGARGHRRRVPPAARPARRSAEPSAHGAPLGARGSVAHPRRSADGRAAGRPRARGSAHLRALVHARRPAHAAPLSRGRTGALRPSPLAGPRLHDRRCGGPAGLRPGQDAAAARADLPRPHRRGDALVAEPRRSPGHCGAAVPCAGCAVERRRLMTTGPQARHAVTVLVVDDEAPLRRVLDRALSRDGYRVLSVASAEEAYDLLSREQPDALLLDIHLPTMSGLSLYLAIKARWPQLQGRVAIMTGDAEAEEVGAWLERNPCALIRKPFDLAQVTAWVASVLRWQREQLGNG